MAVRRLVDVRGHTGGAGGEQDDEQRDPPTLLLEWDVAAGVLGGGLVVHRVLRNGRCCEKGSAERRGTHLVVRRSVVPTHRRREDAATHGDSLRGQLVAPRRVLAVRAAPFAHIASSTRSAASPPRRTDRSMATVLTES